MRQNNNNRFGTGAHFFIGGIFSSLSNERMSPVLIMLLLPLLALAQQPPAGKRGSNTTGITKTYPRIPKQSASRAESSTTQPLNTSTSQQSSTTVQQPSTPIRPLAIGDTVPDMMLPTIMNYPTSAVTLSAFRGRVLILDFWATWCTSCLRYFPKMEALQKEFDGRLQVLLVNTANTRDTYQKITAFLEKRKNPSGRPYSLPIVYNDTLLDGLFPHKVIPHYVVVDTTGRVAAITSSEYIDAAAIEKTWAGALVRLPLKTDAETFDPARPLLQDGNGGEAGALRFRTTLTGYLPNLSGSYREYNDSLFIKKTYLNWPILNLYRLALSFTASHVVLEVSDPAQYLRSACPPARWHQTLHSWEITAPRGTPAARIKAFLLQDLNRYLDLNGRMEKRAMPCLVLQCTDSTRLSTGGGPRVLHLPRTGESYTKLQNTTLAEWVEALNGGSLEGPFPPIVVDESGVSRKVDLQLTASFDALPELNRQLERYGLRIVQATRVVPVFVLSETSHP